MTEWWQSIWNRVAGLTDHWMEIVIGLAVFVFLTGVVIAIT